MQKAFDNNSIFFVRDTEDDLTTLDFVGTIAMLKDWIISFFRPNRIDGDHKTDLAIEMQKAIGDVPSKIVQFLFGGVLIYKSGLEPFVEKFKITSTDSAKKLFQNKEFYEQFILYLESNYHLFALAIAIYIWYVNYKAAVSNEIGILRSLFVEHKVPSGWHLVENGRWARMLPWLFYGTFFLLAYTMNNIQIFGLVMAILLLLDVHGNLLIRRNSERFLSDNSFDPDGPMRLVVMSRREAAVAYWIKRPHVERIILFLIICLIS